jgi:hypothetical protein
LVGINHKHQKSLKGILNNMMLRSRNFVTYLWNFVFNHEVSPLRNIPDVAIRHYVLQGLALMWGVMFSAAIGSYTVLAATLIGHSVLIAAAAITVATWTAATIKPEFFARSSVVLNQDNSE